MFTFKLNRDRLQPQAVHVILNGPHILQVYLCVLRLLTFFLLTLSGSIFRDVVLDIGMLQTSLPPQAPGPHNVFLGPQPLYPLRKPHPDCTPTTRRPIAMLDDR